MIYRTALIAIAIISQPAVAQTPSHLATAALMTSDGKSVGKARLKEIGGRLHLTLHVSRQTPGEHGLHIHAIGLCTPPDFASAGGHWNPTGHQHGLQNPMGPHAGDMANLIVGANGVGRANIDLGPGSLSEGSTPLLDTDGAAIVIHQTADDMKTDPSGNSGKRLACGVFKIR